MRRVPCFLALLILGVGLVESAAPPRVTDDAENLVYFGDAGPVLIRLHMRVDGRPHREAWDEMIDKLFAYADRNKDGVLSEAEAKALPAASVLSSGPFFAFGGGGSPPKAVKMTRHEVEEYYRRAGLRPLALSRQGSSANSPMVGNNSSRPDRMNARMFELLDTNGDGILTREELAAAPKILGKLDTDEDEWLTHDEILGKGGRTSADDEGFTFATLGTDNSTVGDLPLHIATGAEDAELGRRLLRHYGKKGAKSLDAKRARLPADLFAKLDRNRDGVLDAEELSRFAAVALPDAELTIRHSRSAKTSGLRKRPAVPAPPNTKSDSTAQKYMNALTSMFTPKAVDSRQGVSLDPSRRASSVGVKVKQSDETVVLEIGATKIIFSLTVGEQNDFNYNVKEQYRMLFQMADMDNNGYLDRTEANKNPIFRSVFDAMDRDGDGMLYEKEMLSYLDAMDSLRKKVILSCLTLGISEQGKSLFDVADTNSDGKLSLRELRGMGKAIDKLGRDGTLSLTQIPREYGAAFARGPAGGNSAFQTVYMSGPSEPPAAPAKGPLWFRKMDRNRDGDLSRKEWLGSDEDFDAIDTDRDGLISLAEAEAYDKAKRKK